MQTHDRHRIMSACKLVNETFPSSSSQSRMASSWKCSPGISVSNVTYLPPTMSALTSSDVISFLHERTLTLRVQLSMSKHPE